MIPILSAIICFPILVFIIICALRYRAMRLRRKEHRKRLRGGIRGGRLSTPFQGPGERSSYFSQNSSSGEAPCKPPIDTAFNDKVSYNRQSSQMSHTTSSLQVPMASSSATYSGIQKTSRSTSLSYFEPSFIEDASTTDEDKDCPDVEPEKVSPRSSTEKQSESRLSVARHTASRYLSEKYRPRRSPDPK